MCMRFIPHLPLPHAHQYMHSLIFSKLSIQFARTASDGMARFLALRSYLIHKQQTQTVPGAKVLQGIFLLAASKMQKEKNSLGGTCVLKKIHKITHCVKNMFICLEGRLHETRVSS